MISTSDFFLLLEVLCFFLTQVLPPSAVLLCGLYSKYLFIPWVEWFSYAHRTPLPRPHPQAVIKLFPQREFPSRRESLYQLLRK